MIEPQVLLIATLFLPFLAAAGINLFGRVPVLREIWQVIIASALIIAVYMLYDGYIHENYSYAKLVDILPGIGISFTLEPLGLVYAGIASVLWLFSIIYSAGYLRYTNDNKQTGFFIWFALSIAAALGLAFAANLITMFIFYEMLTLVTYPLVIHNGGKEAKAAGRTYLAYLLGSSLAFLLPAIAAIYLIAGNVEFIDGGILYKTEISTKAKIIIFLLFLFGAAKSAIMPMHRWLPAAMVAPAPVSGLLHAVAVVKAGVFVIGKVVIYVFGDILEFTSYFQSAIMYLAAVTIVIASIFALREQSLKRRLAYSTISNLSYIILAFLILTNEGIRGAGAHMAAHAVGKITLFFALGAIILITGANYMKDINGMGKRAPIFFLCFFLCSLSIIGMPFTAGGESKELIMLAAKAAEFKWVEYLLYGSMALSALYLLPISYYAFFKPGKEAATQPNSWLMSVAVIGTTALTLSYPLYDKFITKLLEKVII